MKNKPALYLTSKETLICSDHVQVVRCLVQEMVTSMLKGCPQKYWFCCTNR